MVTIPLCTTTGACYDFYYFSEYIVEYFGTRWKRGKVLCVYSKAKHNNGKARSGEDHGASPSLWKEYYLKTRQTIQVGSGKLNTSREKHF
jgi:hypothetical protein